MNGYAGKTAQTEDLWNVLSEVSGIQVNSMMEPLDKAKRVSCYFCKIH